MPNPNEPLARVHIPADLKQAAMMLGVVTPALLTTLRALAAQHGNKHGKWFDDLAADLIKKAKGNEGVGVAMSDEVAGINAGLEAVHAVLDVVRRDLA